MDRWKTRRLLTFFIIWTCKRKSYSSGKSNTRRWKRRRTSSKIVTWTKSLITIRWKLLQRQQKSALSKLQMSSSTKDRKWLTSTTSLRVKSKRHRARKVITWLSGQCTERTNTLACRLSSQIKRKVSSTALLWLWSMLTRSVLSWSESFSRKRVTITELASESCGFRSCQVSSNWCPQCSMC